MANSMANPMTNAIGSAWPISSVWAIGTLVGVSMLFSGVTRLVLSVAARRIAA